MISFTIDRQQLHLVACRHGHIEHMRGSSVLHEFVSAHVLHTLVHHFLFSRKPANEALRGILRCCFDTFVGSEE